VRPDPGHIEDIPAVVFCLFWLHDLKVHSPRREIALLNGVVKVGGMVVGVLSCNFICFCLREIFDALVSLEMDFDINEAGLYIV